MNDQTKLFTDCPTFKRPKERKQGRPISNGKRSLKLCHTQKKKTTSAMSKTKKSKLTINQNKTETNTQTNKQN